MSSEAPRANPLIGRLAAGEVVIGVWTGAWSAPRITRVIATSGVDFIVADVEHDLYDFNAMQRFLLQVNDFATRYGGVQPPAVLVKLAHRAGWDPRYEIAETLKIGPAMGIWVPFVESAADLSRAISAARGCEGFAHAGLNIPPAKRDVWPLNPQGEYFVVAMIESEEGARHAEEIVATPGLGAVEVVHLSSETEARILALCKRHGVLGAVTAGPDEVQTRIGQGYKLISIGWDFALLAAQLEERVRSVRSEAGRSKR